MSIIPQLKSKWKESGIRGITSSALRYIPDHIDFKTNKSGSRTKLMDEFLTWVRFAVPGMLAEGMR